MAVRGAQESSLRLARLESTRLAWAFAISIALHLLLWGGYAIDKKFHIWDRIHFPPWLKAITQLAAKVKKEPLPQVDREAPLMFVDVSPYQATPEPPKNARFYSDKNSQAANPDADRDTDTPKITGTQTQVAKTEDVPRNRFDKLMPAPAPPQREQSADEAKPKPAMTPGDLTMAKPDLNPRRDNGTADQPRPRTIQEALARQQDNRLPGQKMKQEGGTRRLALVPSLDAKQTPFGVYDRAFIETVQQRWYDLLENTGYDGYRQGKVVLQFHLNVDGRITDMKVLENNVGEMLGLLCQKAVLDLSPFEKWPREMRLMVDRDFRELTFTFYYN